MTRVIANKYEELEPLGQGGQGLVSKVRHVDHKTILALKVLPSYLLENPEMVARFEQEALLMTRMHHRNIVRVLGSGRDDTLKSLYIVMEYIQGRTLKQYIRDKGPLPLAEVLEITRQIAGALHYAHTQSPPVIHRDIKPTNIMIEDVSGRVVILDFGIAKELGDGDGAKTKTGVMVGTWKYSSPEQLRHEPLTGGVDVYSVGMVMYEMYTGAQFYSGLDEYAVLGKVLYDTQEHEPYFSRPTPPEFVELVRKAIARSRVKRYTNMKDFLNALEACWSTLDETKTMILPTLGSVISLPENRDPVDVEQIEEEIRRLQAERQRLIVTTTQRQVQDAREQAERESAQQWAPEFFQQGLSQEEEGEARLRDQAYGLAQEAFRNALGFFTQAREAAAATAALRQTEQARQGVKTARADADRYDARARARSVYHRASTLQDQAEALWVQKHYELAQQRYMEARSLFEDARDLAYRETLREEAEAARVLARATREKAIGEGSETFAGVALQEATAVEQQAAAALQREDFTQARTLYEAAHQKYQQAQRQARVEQRRQEVAVTAQHVRQARQRALAEGLREDHPLYQQGVSAQLRAEAYVAAQDYTQAEREYTQARTHYEVAAQEAELERQQYAVRQARQQMNAAQASARAVQADQRLPREWKDLQQEVALVEAAAGRQAFAEALMGYEQVRRRFDQVAQMVRDQQERETERQRQEAVTLAQQVLLVKRAAEAVAPWLDSSLIYRRANEAWRQAEEDFVNRHYVEASHHYSQAGELYAASVREGERQHQRQAATQARQQMESVRAAAAQAKAELYTPDGWGEAQTLAQSAQQQETHEDFALAAMLYRQATQRFTQLQQEAIVQAQRTIAEIAEAARQEMFEVKTQAEAFTKWAKENWVEAQAREAQAAVAFQNRDYHQAAEEYEGARQLYLRTKEYGEAEQRRQKEERQAAILLLQQAERLREETERAKAEQEAARQETERSRSEAEESNAAELASNLYGQALALQTQAEEDRNRQAYAQATPGYAEASRIFSSARTLARQIRLQRDLDTLKSHVQAARAAAEKEDAATLATAAWQAAVRTEQQAARALQQEEWSNTERLYRTACEEYEEAQRQAVSERQRQHALMVAQQRQAALRACQQMKEAQVAAERVGAAQRFVADWENLQQQIGVAQQNEQREEFNQAATLYSQLQQRFEGLRREAERQVAEEKARRRQRALLAREQAEQSSQEAERVEAQSYVPERYAQAVLKMKEGEQRLAAKDWEQAEALFLQVRELFIHAVQSTHREKAKQTARTVQERALLAQQEARRKRGEELLPQQFGEASALIRTGQQDLEREQFTRAQASFEKSQRLFQQIIQDAAVIIARQQQVAQEKAVNASVLAEAPSISALPSVTTSMATSKPFVLLSSAALLMIGVVGLYLVGPFRSSPQKATDLALPMTQTISPPSKSPVETSQEKKRNEPATPETSVSVAATAAKSPSPVTAEPQTKTQPSRSSQDKKLEPEESRVPPQSQNVAKVSPPAPVAPPVVNPPSIIQALPKPGREVSVAEGEKLAFAVDARSAQPETLRYTWFLNGEKRAEGKKWLYQPGYEEGGKGAKEVKVVVTDGKTAPAEQRWTVQVDDVDRPPVITGTTPKAGVVEVASGETPSFSIQAADPDKDDSLVYIWSVDGKEILRGDQKNWQLPASSDTVPRNVKVEVVDKGGKSSQVAWNVSLKAPLLPPRITSAEPEKDDLVLQTGQTIDFSVKAMVLEDNDKTKKKLSYQWTVNGNSIRAGDNGDLRFSETRPGTYRVSVVAINQGGQKSNPRDWKVEVRAPEVSPPPALSQLSAAEISSWLESYRRAWEGRDVETLVALGAISGQDARNLQPVLAAYKEFHVAFTDIDIQREGDQAKVSFKRIDTIEGRSLPHPDRIALTLEKRADGRIVVLRR